MHKLVLMWKAKIQQGPSAGAYSCRTPQQQSVPSVLLGEQRTALRRRVFQLRECIQRQLSTLRAQLCLDAEPAHTISETL